MRLILARHGETLWNVEGRHQGRIDIPLSDAGVAQAEALRQRLEEETLHRVVASPLSRARETAERAVAGRGLTVGTDGGWLELDHGTWEGRVASELDAEAPDLRRAWRERPHETRLPGGETLQEVLDRAWPALIRATEGAGPEDTVLVVTHDGVIRVLLARILGLPLARVWSFRLAPTGLTLLEGADPARLVLVRLNDGSHLFSLFGEPQHRRL